MDNESFEVHEIHYRDGISVTTLCGSHEGIDLFYSTNYAEDVTCAECLEKFIEETE